MKKRGGIMQRRAFLNLGLASLGTTLATAIPVPAQYIPNPSSRKWAILFGTWCGTARDASIWISDGMGGIATVMDIRQFPSELSQNLEAVRTQYPGIFDIRPASVDLSAYDHLIIGTAIHGGKGPQALEAYLSKNADRLKSKIRGLFIVCGNMGKQPGAAQVTSYIDGWLAPLCKVGSVYKKACGGRITKALMSDADYKQFGSFTGEYDNLSRTDCMSFGKQIYSANS
jgi:hypothetical protein